ncbi:ABC-three component system protein [Arsenicibacter rosenii]|uniref:ABC-three component systems C-terminal domain-containing protein n=1 Tax=Arsenicibacter rosenii TaxID=1750698 RepID=A0A1S2VCX1_9BACT|nr:ABC-three component system protein [Arsenicibacter rosenii]OIN56617.1 hypothetical protein BLX24_23590 [Arsenicibacter rosenii]
MANFPLTSLRWQDFEELCIAICKDYLGIGTVTFADGPDGGRDAYFRGTAEKFPSTAVPWSGKFIIQCKHTNKHDASCADSAFKDTILNKEIVKLSKNITNGEIIDNYIIFTNRTMPGAVHGVLIEKISEQTTIKNVEIIGREFMNSMLSTNDSIITRFGLNKFSDPIRFDSEDIKKLIVFFSEANREGLLNNKPQLMNNDQIVIYNLQKEEKNKINNISQNYFQFILEDSLPFFQTIEDFLKNPINTEYALMYENTVLDIKAKIILNEASFPTLAKAFEHIYDYVYERHKEVLSRDRRVLRVFIHFMYFNCDIGKNR